MLSQASVCLSTGGGFGGAPWALIPGSFPSLWSQDLSWTGRAPQSWHRSCPVLGSSQSCHWSCTRGWCGMLSCHWSCRGYPTYLGVPPSQAGQGYQLGQNRGTPHPRTEERVLVTQWTVCLLWFSGGGLSCCKLWGVGCSLEVINRAYTLECMTSRWDGVTLRVMASYIEKTHSPITWLSLGQYPYRNFWILD